MIPRDAESKSNANNNRYWKRNLQILIGLLTVWWLVSFGAGIIWVDTLNAFQIPYTGFKVGFWFAQQGSIYVFVVLIFLYARLMNKLDAAHNVDEK